MRAVRVILMLPLLAIVLSLNAASPEQPYGLDRRIPWTTSRVIGSPDPPLPYAVVRTFTNIQWKAPLFITPEPDTDYLLVALQGGEDKRPSKVVRVSDDEYAKETTGFLELSNRLIYSVAFHPGFRTNRHLYVFTHGVSGIFARTNRISRFTVVDSPIRQCDPKSEHIVLEWRSEGHDGGGLVFGHDGMMYISTGDGTSDSDGWVSGQDLSELLGGVLRIDVDRTNVTQRYSVPSDNPFVALTNARPENWAYGLRNPWRLCVDARTGQIWTGNNGQDHWETAHLVRRGENYGWSVYEGSHPFYLNRKLGPTPVVPPTLEHSHSEARSLTGGIVYYGEELPELDGVYVYGDYSTGRIWGARHNGRQVAWHKELATSQLQISAFATTRRGRLLIADHGGGLYRLVRSPKEKPAHKFPTRLSDTGIFASTKDHRPHAGVLSYSVNAPGWADGATIERLMALPDDSRIGKLTNGAVLVQTLSIEQEPGNAVSRRRIETRLLTMQSGQWAGYSYRWNDSQTDATLVPGNGDQREIAIKEKQGGAKRRHVWRFPSRAECMTCHSRAAEFVLGLNDLQLNRDHDYAGVRDNQLRTLHHIGLYSGARPKPGAKALSDPYDTSKDLDSRARAYLHVNCSVCHVEAGGGNSKMELGIGRKPEQMNLFSARPQHDSFGIDNAMLVFPGDPDRSVLFQRISRRGRGQMPPLVSSVVDQRAVELFRDWINAMKPEQTFVRDWKMEDLTPLLDKAQRGRSLENGRESFRAAGCGQCHQFAGEGGSVGPNLSGIGRRLAPPELLESMVLPSTKIAEGYGTIEIETRDGETVTGRVEREDDRAVTLRPSLAVAETVTIRKADIRRREISKNSNMPTGILNTLTEAQILDLLAYLLSDGDGNHSAFKR